jgi:hypothetical protein
MTDDQFHAIKRRIIRGDPYELWFNIYQILFPNAPKPLSPYISTAEAATINHFVTLFRWFGPEELMNMMNDRQRRGEGRTLNLSTQAVVDEAFEIAIPNFLERRRYSQNPHTFGTQDSEMSEEFQDEEPLTMAPLSGVRPSRRNVPQRNETEDENALRAGQLTSSHATDIDTAVQLLPSYTLPSFNGSFPEEPQMATSEGWASTEFDLSQINVAFNTYAPFNHPILQPSQWAFQNSGGLDAGGYQGELEIGDANFRDYCS